MENIYSATPHVRAMNKMWCCTAEAAAVYDVHYSITPLKYLGTAAI
ncbi:hypothetical protein MWG46_21385 [Escherichia coli]|nr:hypothetical protein [Escherichia coli]